MAREKDHVGIAALGCPGSKAPVEMGGTRARVLRHTLRGRLVAGRFYCKEFLGEPTCIFFQQRWNPLRIG